MKCKFLCKIVVLSAPDSALIPGDPMNECDIQNVLSSTTLDNVLLSKSRLTPMASFMETILLLLGLPLFLLSSIFPSFIVISEEHYLLKMCSK